MAAPNIARVKRILSKNAKVIAGTTATTVLTNASNSHQVLKIGQISAGNSGENPVNVTFDILRGLIRYRFIPGYSVPSINSNCLTDFLSKPIYLEEGDSLRVTCDVDNAVEVSVSYEEMMQVIA